jgi:hypothetical protein
MFRALLTENGARRVELERECVEEGEANVAVLRALRRMVQAHLNDHSAWVW